MVTTESLLILVTLINNFLKLSFDAKTIKSIIELKDYMVSIDLAEAFFSIPLHQDSKDFVTFEYKSIRYSNNVLPFGLASSRFFSKMLKPVIVHLRFQGIKITFYLDDIFICFSCPNTLICHLILTLSTLTSLGFNINNDKSSVIPSRTLLHLGYTWCSNSMSLSLPADNQNLQK